MTTEIVIGTHAIDGQPVQTASARDLHKELGVAKDFSNWVKAQIKRAGLIENVDFVTVAQKGVGGKFDAIEYHLTLEAGKHVAMMAGVPKGKEVRQYFIECERIAKAVKPPVSTAPVVRDTRTAALIEALIRQDALEQEQQRQSAELARISENVAVIEARTQPENKHFTVLGYSNLIGKKIDIATASRLGRKCAELSRTQGMVIGDVTDPRFGKVHSYHETILQAVLDSTART